MAKKIHKNEDNGDNESHDETNTETGKFQISYMQGDDEINLSFLTSERRDHELQRLRGTGILASKIDAD